VTPSGGGDPEGRHPVRVLPADEVVLVDPEDDLFWAARQAGWSWPTSCNGNCECGQCFVIVEEGEENLSPMRDDERERLAVGLAAGKPRARLACQVYLSGPAVVTKRGARPRNIRS
jgi:ferredoxin, 2Fe-2S